MGCHLLLQGDLSDPGIELGSPALQVDDLPTELWGSPKISSVQFRHYFGLGSTLLCYSNLTSLNSKHFNLLQTEYLNTVRNTVKFSIFCKDKSERFLTLLWLYSEGIFTFLKLWVSVKDDTGQVILEWLKILRLWTYTRSLSLCLVSRNIKNYSLSRTLSKRQPFCFFS